MMVDCKKMTIEGCDISYSVHGKSGPGLLLVSGFTADRHVWDLVVNDLATRYRVLVFDNPGIGQSYMPDTLSVEKMADIAHALAKNVFQGDYHLAGHSMGGAIAMTVAKKFGNEISSLALLCSFPRLGVPFKMVCELKMQMYDDGLSAKYIDQLALPWAFSDKFLSQDGVLSTIYKMQEENPCPQPKKGYKAQLGALLSFDAHGWLNQIEVPALILAGKDDLIAPEQDSIYLNKQIKNSKLMVMDQTGHVPQIERPAEFVNIVNDFLG